VAFSVAQYEAVISRLDAGTQTLGAKIPDVAAAANAVLADWFVPGPVKEAVKWLAEKIVEIAEWVWNKIVELLKGAAAPVYMFEYAWAWQDIRGTATGVASELTPAVVGISQDWQGAAADAYAKAVAPQTAAAAQIGSIAGQTATSLTLCATGALTFYVALGIIVAEFIAQLVAAVVAIGSIVFSWAGLAMVAEDCGVNAGMIWAAVGTLAALLGTQASQMAALHGQAVDHSAFPGGHWPQATTG
jgi:hypothetical protein